MADRVYNVLFLCTGNSARSIIAEALMNRIGGGRFRAFSAGSHPTGRVNPHALRTLADAGLPTAALYSKSWDEFAGARALPMDFIVTVCDNAAGEVCPVWPGQPITAHWSIPDPAAVEGTEAQRAAAFADVAKVLRRRMELFASLPVEKLDRLSIQSRINELGTHPAIV